MKRPPTYSLQSQNQLSTLGIPPHLLKSVCRFTPGDFATGGNIYPAATQQKDFQEFYRNPIGGHLFCVTGDLTSGNQPDMLAAILLQAHNKVRTKTFEHYEKWDRRTNAPMTYRENLANPIWVRYYPGADHDGVDAPYPNVAAYERMFGQPSFIVLSNLSVSSPRSALEFARDCIEYHHNVPRVVVAQGADPITFMTQYLFKIPTGVTYFGTQAIKSSKVITF